MSGSIGAIFWYVWIGTISLGPLIGSTVAFYIGMLFYIVLVIIQSFLLTTKKIKNTILAWIASFISSKVLIIGLFILWHMLLKIFNISYENTSIGMGLLLILHTWIYIIAECITLILSIIHTKKHQNI